MRRKIALLALFISVPFALFAMGAKPFVLVDEYHSDLTGTVYYTYDHVKTGFRVVYEHNTVGDNYSAFIFNTPVHNGADLSHIFEHSLGSGSEKYPSSYLYFDLINRAYFSEINAMTGSNLTFYYAASRSAKQMELYIDAIMSCIDSSAVLSDENVFKREGIRFDLFSKDDAIKASGTVFNEDMGNLTNELYSLYKEIYQSLYDGTHFAYRNGLLPLYIEDCTYENLLKVYDDYYNWDNILLYLYGDLDIEKILNMLDSEYLSKAERRKTDLSILSEEVGSGYREKRAYSPAYSSYENTAGDATIVYTFDLRDFRLEDYYALFYIFDEVTKDGGIFDEELKRFGVVGIDNVYVDIGNPRPVIMFFLTNTDESQKEAFRLAVDSTLERCASGELDKESIKNYASKVKRDYRYQSENGSLRSTTTMFYIDMFTLYDRLDVASVLSTALDNLENKKDYSYLFSSIREEDRLRSLVVLTPKAGLYEEIISDIDKYLTDMKASLSDEEIDALIKETEEYYEWVANSSVNYDISIDKEEVEDISLDLDIKEVKGDGVNYKSIEVEEVDALRLSINFPLSMITKEEDKNLLAIYSLLLDQFDTPSYKHSDVEELIDRYFYEFNVFFSEIDGKPYLTLSAELDKDDLESGISLIEEILINSIISKDTIETYLGEFADAYNIKRTLLDFRNVSDFRKLFTTKEGLYTYDIYYDGFYDYAQYVLENLDRINIIEGLERIKDTVIRKGSVEVLVFGEGGSKERAIFLIEEFLSSLDSEVEYVGEYEDLDLGSIAFVTNSSVGNLYYFINLDESESISASYFPFLGALSNDLIMPLRTAGGAYSAGARALAPSNVIFLYTTADSAVEKTFETFIAAFDKYKSAVLNEEDLNANALKVLALSDVDTEGKLEGAEQRYDLIKLYGKERGEELLNGAKDSSLSDLDDALNALGSAFKENGRFIYIGPESLLSPIRENFSTIVDLR